MEKWSWPNEAERPFGLRVGEQMTLNGLTIERQQVLAPNWNYAVADGGRTYRVNALSLNEGKYRIRVQGEWHGSELGTHIPEDVDAQSPEDALVEALMRVIALRSERH